MSDSEHFDRAIDKLLDDQSPRAELAGLDAEEQQMLRMAQLLRGSRGQTVSPEFAERLHGRIFPQSRRISRRTAFVSGLGALAAGLAAGIGLDRVATSNPQQAKQPPLVGPSGKWKPIVRLAEVGPGAVYPFTAGAVQGFLINQGGELRALSRICTHMGCTLQFRQRESAFVCPCHGAEFDLQGELRWQYAIPIRPLPPIDVRVRGEFVEVRTV